VAYNGSHRASPVVKSSGSPCDAFGTNVKNVAKSVVIAATKPFDNLAGPPPLSEKLSLIWPEKTPGSSVLFDAVNVLLYWNVYVFPLWSVAVPWATDVLLIVVVPSSAVLVLVIEVSVPEPVTVVPLGRFGHVAELRVKVTGNVSTVAPPANALPAPAAIARTATAATAIRFN